MKSPWIHELQRMRPVSALLNNTSADVAIIGAGIAGISTAFFTLLHTNHSVILIDSSKVAHGATGHNAGQITSYFERPFSEMVQEFGLAQAVAGQRAIETAWMLLDEILDSAQLTTPVYHVTGYAGFSTEEKILEHITNNALKIQGGVVPEALYIAQEWLATHTLPAQAHDLYTAVPHKDILSMLETTSTEYIACIEARKGCTNSARLCEELVGWMLKTYSGRFILAEHAHIDTVKLNHDHQELRTTNYMIRAQHTILCTNGFEQFSIQDSEGKNINSRFHKMIHGTIGYMVAYEHDGAAEPAAKSYFPLHAMATSDATEPDAYYYLTRRPFQSKEGTLTNLICVGGPEETLSESARYSPNIPHADSALRDARAFINATIPGGMKNDEFAFQWHGLMGYTPNAIRRIGPDPEYSSLYYNLGCNGVGILPSIYGGRRIARYLAQEKVEPSIFDIPKQE